VKSGSVRTTTLLGAVREDDFTVVLICTEAQGKACFRAPKLLPFLYILLYWNFRDM